MWIVLLCDFPEKVSDFAYLYAITPEQFFFFFFTNPINFLPIAFSYLIGSQIAYKIRKCQHTCLAHSDRHILALCVKNFLSVVVWNSLVVFHVLGSLEDF